VTEQSKRKTQVHQFPSQPTPKAQAEVTVILEILFERAILRLKKLQGGGCSLSPHDEDSLQIYLGEFFTQEQIEVLHPLLSKHGVPAGDFSLLILLLMKEYSGWFASEEGNFKKER
jgi:hypothetical protein